MPYIRSSFRNEFDTIVDEYICIIKEADKNTLLTQKLKNSVLASSVFQVSSAMENYLKDIISNWIFEIKKCCFDDISIPDEMKAIVLLKSQQDIYRKYLVSTTGERESLQLMIGKLDLISKVSSQNILQVLNENVLVNDKKYPSNSNIRQLFNRIGIKDIFQELDRIGRYDSKMFLTSFMDIRTEIAHSNSHNNLNASDVIIKLNGMKTLIGHIDRILHKHILTYSLPSCWKKDF